MMALVPSCQKVPMFQKVKIACFYSKEVAGKEINHIVKLEKKITSELKLLKDKEIINKSTYKSIKPVGGRPGILYALGKIRKETRNRIPSF